LLMQLPAWEVIRALLMYDYTSSRDLTQTPIREFSIAHTSLSRQNPNEIEITILRLTHPEN